jgi:hypothetical protein
VSDHDPQAGMGLENYFLLFKKKNIFFLPSSFPSEKRGEHVTAPG